MLLIAQPKSASTSLMLTLGKILNKTSLQLTRKGLRKRGIGKMKRGDNPFFRLPHHDMIEYNKKVLVALANDDKQIYKQHIAPTSNNKKLIKKNDLKCVVLLRDPEACAEAYERHMSVQNRAVKTGRVNKPIPQEKREESLRLFYRGWQSMSHYKNVHIVYFEDLVINPTKAVNEILEFWGFDTVPRVNLSKARFTGKGLMKLQNKIIKPKPLKPVGKVRQDVYKSYSYPYPEEWAAKWSNPKEWEKYDRAKEPIPYHLAKDIVLGRMKERMFEAYEDEWWGTPTMLRPMRWWQFLKKRRFKEQIRDFREELELEEQIWDTYSERRFSDSEILEWFNASGLEFPVDELKPYGGPPINAMHLDVATVQHYKNTGEKLDKINREYVECYS